MLRKPKRIQDLKELIRVRGERCLVCGGKSEACHVKSKGSGGDDTAANLISMCRVHHAQQHALGWVRFCLRFPVVEVALEERGWKIVNELGVRKLRKA